MYLFRIDDRTYVRRDGQPMSLTEAMAAVYGCGNAGVIRTDGTMVVERAGSASEVTYAPTGRRIVRGMTNRARRRWLATQEPTIRAEVNARAYVAR